jgi:hypothetical protein
MDNFYVYMYLRAKSSKHGAAGSPYYVGKGKGMRAYSKEHRVRPPKDLSLVVFTMRDIPEEAAFAEEMRLIALHGRIDNSTGCLRNLTDGGEGQSGRVMPDAEKEALRQRMIGKRYALGHKQDPESVRLRVEKTRGYKAPPRSDQWLERQRAAKCGKKQSAESVAKRSESLKAAYASGKRKPVVQTEEFKARLRARKDGKVFYRPPKKLLPCRGCGDMLSSTERHKRHPCGSTNRVRRNGALYVQIGS